MQVNGEVKAKNSTEPGFFAHLIAGTAMIYLLISLLLGTVGTFLGYMESGSQGFSRSRTRLTKVFFAYRVGYNIGNWLGTEDKVEK